ncbi:hypothetical protein Hypma_011779 [Hypsizygus marmoreus]|uniref:Uncharacterized protein n=1 Tax=Hypsizygus marmoreus TaxID=39966 RepID=A0A369JJ83_HYPMA|nr:hypothetical protein Hypma_011779 [Hypsizygus marmoreus]
MPADPYWECIRLHTELLWSRHSFLRAQSTTFKPGDFAYHSASIVDIFSELLIQKGLPLLDIERWKHKLAGRYCVILERLGADKYLVCYLTTFGRSKDFFKIQSPVSRFFGLPIGQNIFWPGVKPFRTLPPWRASSGSFILGIPVVRKGLEPTNLYTNFTLLPSELTRLKGLIRERMEKFDQHYEQIRYRNIRWLAGEVFRLDRRTFTGTGSGFKPRAYPAKLSALAFSEQQKRHRRLLALLPVSYNDISWLKSHERLDLENRSIYLNSLAPKRTKRRRFTNLPRPFFATSLRADLKTITRMLR